MDKTQDTQVQYLSWDILHAGKVFDTIATDHTHNAESVKNELVTKYGYPESIVVVPATR